VTSRALSAHLPTPSASPLHQSLLPPHPLTDQTPLLQPLATIFSFYSSHY
jgi:hypothetical protein